MSDIARGRGIVDAIAPQVASAEWAVTQDGLSWKAATIDDLRELHAAGESCMVSVGSPAVLLELCEFLRMRAAGFLTSPPPSRE